MFRNFKDLLRTYCLESSFLGLKYFYLYPDWISRCYWAVSLISIISTAFVLSWLLYNRFDEIPTRITIENQYESVESLPYPSIAICSPNQISLSALRHFNLTLVEGNRTLNFDTVLPQLLGFYEVIGDLDQKSISQFETLIENNRYNALDVMGMLPQRCEDFLRLCLFKGKRYPNCKTLFHPILTTKGLCCIFNSVYRFQNKKRNENVKNFTALRANEIGTGIPNALRVIADYNPEDAVDGSIINAGAVRVLIMDSSEFPSEDESNLVHPYSESFHIIHPTYTYCSEDVKALPVLSRKCLFSEERHLHYFGDYQSSECELLCQVREIERQCHCTMMYVPHVHKERSCNISSIACIIRLRIQMNIWYNYKQCDCPRDCESYQYRSEMIIGNLNALQHLAHNIYGDIVFNKSSSLLHFFLPRPFYVKKKQETVMSLVIFFSNLGGVFGLCLGCSIISIIELLFFIIKAIKNSIQVRVHVQHHFIN